MVEETRPPEDGCIEHPLVRYERTDASFGWVLSILIVAMLVAVFHFSMILWFLHRYRDYEAKIKPSAFPLARHPSEALPKDPRLEQVDRLKGRKSSNAPASEASRDETLSSYGLTAEKDFVHIPIERAMDLLAARLPARKETAQAKKKENELLDAGASNSGRLLRGKRR